MPKIIGSSLHEHRQLTRQHLFAALADLMDERGFDAIALADIAARAGVGRTAVYNHFPDKETMLLAFILHETEEYARRLHVALEMTDNPVDQLRIYIRHMRDVAQTSHRAPRPELRTQLSRPTLQRLRDHIEIVEAALRGILERGIASGDFADLDIEANVYLIDACLTARLVSEDPEAQGRAHAAAEQFVMRAVGAR
jgi:AcrR family transcriptional regulator